MLRFQAFGRFLRVIQETSSAADEGSSEQRYRLPLQLWEYVFLAAMAMGILVGGYLECQKVFLTNDELITGILASNPSFSEMISAICRGGELNPPLFFIMEWMMVRCFGVTELALRAIPGLSIALGSWVLYFTVRPLAGPRLAAVAIALVMGLSRDVFYFAREARYYGVLFLLVTLGILLLVRLAGDRPTTKRDYLLIFLVHVTMVYLHLYGLIYSGALLIAMAVMEILRGKPRWGVPGSVVAAWIAFCAWLPATLQQFKSVSRGVYTPPGFYKLGWFVEELALQTPMALVLLFSALLGALALIGRGPLPVNEEARACRAPLGWSALAVTGLGLLAVPVSTWLASFVLTPPPFMRRYAFPCIAAWVILVALLLVAVFRLPAVKPRTRFLLPAWLWTLAWVGVLVFCIGYQPARAKKNPGRPAAPFVDVDYGHRDLPLVFENSWYWVPRVFYGHDREYLLFIDRDAAEADPSWYTGNMQGFFQSWHPEYGRAKIAYYNELPEAFIAFDDDYTKTFEWVFAQHPELKRELLGTRPAELELHGKERIWLVHKPAAWKKN